MLPLWIGGDGGYSFSDVLVSSFRNRMYLRAHRTTRHTRAEPVSCRAPEGKRESADDANGSVVGKEGAPPTSRRNTRMHERESDAKYDAQTDQCPLAECARAGPHLPHTHTRSLSTSTVVVPPINRSDGQSMNLWAPAASLHTDLSQVRTLVPMDCACL
jgi:hypothetical protein